jgi:hypothetical protein
MRLQHRLKVVVSVDNCVCWVSTVPSDQVRYATTTQRLVAHCQGMLVPMCPKCQQAVPRGPMQQLVPVLEGFWIGLARGSEVRSITCMQG